MIRYVEQHTIYNSANINYVEKSGINDVKSSSHNLIYYATILLIIELIYPGKYYTSNENILGLCDRNANNMVPLAWVTTNNYMLKSMLINRCFQARGPFF